MEANKAFKEIATVGKDARVLNGAIKIWYNICNGSHHWGEVIELRSKNSKMLLFAAGASAEHFWSHTHMLVMTSIIETMTLATRATMANN